MVDWDSPALRKLLPSTTLNSGQNLSLPRSVPTSSRMGAKRGDSSGKMRGKLVDNHTALQVVIKQDNPLRNPNLL